MVKKNSKSKRYYDNYSKYCMLTAKLNSDKINKIPNVRNVIFAKTNLLRGLNIVHTDLAIRTINVYIFSTFARDDSCHEKALQICNHILDLFSANIPTLANGRHNRLVQMGQNT